MTTDTIRPTHVGDQSPIGRTNGVTDMMTDPVSQDDADAQRLAEGLRQLRELRGEYDNAVSGLEKRREAGRRRVAELQAQIEAENAEMVGAVTGFATNKALLTKGLGTIRIYKKN
jgi:hypothetical protein